LLSSCVIKSLWPSGVLSKCLQSMITLLPNVVVILLTDSHVYGDSARQLMQKIWRNILITKFFVDCYCYIELCTRFAHCIFLKYMHLVVDVKSEFLEIYRTARFSLINFSWKLIFFFIWLNLYYYIKMQPSLLLLLK